MSSIMSPIPPTGGTGGILGTIVKVIKTVVGLFKKPAEEAGKTDSVNDNSSASDIDKITQIFIQFKEEVHSKSVEIEKAVSSEVGYYVEELHNILDENADKVNKYGIRIKAVERQIDKIGTKLNGIIDYEISKKVSLDNSECKDIMRMIPGSKKEEKMTSFLEASVKSALNVCCSELHDSLAEIYDDVEGEIIGTVEALQKQNEINRESLKSIDENNYQDTAKKQMISAYYITDICSLVELVIE